MGNKAQILVIADDDQADRLLLKTAIEDVGLTIGIVEKSDGEEALHFFKNECSVLEPSLIILDINMPIYTGLEVLEYATNNPSLCATPVIVFSTSSLEQDQNKAMELGASGYVTKPSDYDGYLKFANELKTILEAQSKKS